MHSSDDTESDCWSFLRNVPQCLVLRQYGWETPSPSEGILKHLIPRGSRIMMQMIKQNGDNFYNSSLTSSFFSCHFTLFSSTFNVFLCKSHVWAPNLFFHFIICLLPRGPLLLEQSLSPSSGPIPPLFPAPSFYHASAHFCWPLCSHHPAPSAFVSKRPFIETN